MTNLLSRMRMAGTIRNAGTQQKPRWELVSRRLEWSVLNKDPNKLVGGSPSHSDFRMFRTLPL